MEIVRRNLTPIEARIIYDGIRKTSNITGHSVKELGRYHTIVALDGKMLVGVGAWIEVSKKWDELLILFVREEYRNQGIGKQLFGALVADMRGRNIFSASRNPIVIKLLRDNDFKIVKFDRLPRDIKIFYFRYSLNPNRIREYLRKNFLKNNKPFVYGLFYC